LRPKPGPKTATNRHKFIREKNGHGMSFFEDGFDPKVTQVIFDFLQVVFGN